MGPFDEPPHPHYTWAPLLTRPKGKGRRVILDLSFGDYSVNGATCKEFYDNSSFSLKLPSLDNLVGTLQSLGIDARVFKVDISRAFRNVPIDPADAIHLGIKWQEKFYIDKNLAFGAVHGTAIFERISNFIRFILANKGIQVWNYIDDIYACCHKDEADEAFHTLLQVINSIGLPVNPKKVFQPCEKLSILGIVVDIYQGTFSIEDEKLDQILQLCQETIIKGQITKRDLQRLLGKLLYISRCVKGARIFLNHLLSTLREQCDSPIIIPPQGFYLDILWFLRFVKQYNGVVRFRRPSVFQVVFIDATLQAVGGCVGDESLF